MPNFPNPFLLLTAEHLIHRFLMEFIIIVNQRKIQKKNKVVSNYDVRANSGPFFQSITLFPHSQYSSP